MNKDKDLKNHYLVVLKDPQRVHYNPLGAKGQGDLMQVAVQIEGFPVVGLMEGGSTSSLGGQTLYQELRVGNSYAGIYMPNPLSGPPKR